MCSYFSSLINWDGQIVDYHTYNNWFRSVVALHRPGENPMESKNPENGRKGSPWGKNPLHIIQGKSSYTCNNTYWSYYISVPGHLTSPILLARVKSFVSCRTLTSVTQVTGCLPLPVSHSWRISVLIRSGSFKFLWAIFLTLDPVLSLRRKVPNLTYLVAISSGILITLPSVHGNLSSSGSVGLVPGLHAACKDSTTHAVVTRIIVRLVNYWGKACKNVEYLCIHCLLHSLFWEESCTVPLSSLVTASWSGTVEKVYNLSLINGWRRNLLCIHTRSLWAPRRSI